MPWPVSGNVDFKRVPSIPREKRFTEPKLFIPATCLPKHLLFFWACQRCQGTPFPSQAALHMHLYHLLLTGLSVSTGNSDQNHTPASVLGAAEQFFSSPTPCSYFCNHVLYLILLRGFFQTTVSTEISQNTPEICMMLFNSWNGFAMHVAFPFLLLLNMYSGFLWPGR